MDGDGKSDEREVLSSIYSGDDHFQAVDENTFQLRVEPEDNPSHPKRFMLQLIWPEDYPSVSPRTNLDIFYNSHLSFEAKQRIASRIAEEAEAWLGSAMTYTLFEYAKENVEELILHEDVLAAGSQGQGQGQENVPVKERREEVVRGGPSDKPRGWDWVDVVKHLGQTGTPLVNKT